MIQKISQSTIKYPNFKQSNKKNDYCLIGKKPAMSINSDLDYQRKIAEQNERKRLKKKEEINNEGTKENQGGVSPCDTLPNSAL